MSEYKKTTGKVYKEIAVKCSDCGKVYLKTDTAICPECGSLKSVRFQRTTASISDEK
jgi:uncharacterized OB-fold protein